MEITEYHIAVLEWNAFQSAAKAIDLEDAELRSPKELENELKEKDSELFEKMSEFLRAYKAWWEYCQGLEKCGETSRERGEESKHVALMKSRDETRKEFLIELRKREQR